MRREALSKTAEKPAEGSGEQVLEILSKIHEGIEKLKKNTSEMVGKLTNIDKQMERLNQQTERMAYSWPPVLVIKDRSNGKVIPPTELRVNQEYEVFFRGRGFESRVAIEPDGQNISSFFTRIRLEPGGKRSKELSHWWVGDLKIEDGFKKGGLRLFFSKKVEGSLKVIVDGETDLIERIVIRRSIGRWLCTALAAILWTIVGLIAKALDILTTLLSFFTFMGGVAVGILSFILIYMASKA